MKNKSWLALVFIVLALVVTHRGFCGDEGGDDGGAESQLAENHRQESPPIFKGKRNAPRLYGILGASREELDDVAKHVKESAGDISDKELDDKIKEAQFSVILGYWKAGNRLFGRGGAKENPKDYDDLEEAFYILRSKRWRTRLNIYFDGLTERGLAADQIDGQYELGFWSSFRQELFDKYGTKTPKEEIIDKDFPAFQAKYELEHPHAREGEDLEWGMTWWDARKMDCVRSFKMIGPVTSILAGGALVTAGGVAGWQAWQALATDHTKDVPSADDLQRKAGGPKVPGPKPTDSGTYVPDLPQRPEQFPKEDKAEEAARRLGGKFKGKIKP